MTRCFVGGIGQQISEEELADAFRGVGAISDVTIVRHADGVGKGFGFVSFESVEARDKAIAELHGSQIQGRTVSVREAVARARRDGPGGRGGFREREREPYQRGGRDSGCFKCGDPDHWARECPLGNGGPPRGGGGHRGGYGDRYGPPPPRGGYRGGYDDGYGPPPPRGGYRGGYDDGYGPPPPRGGGGYRGGYDDGYGPPPPRGDYRGGYDDGYAPPPPRGGGRYDAPPAPRGDYYDDAPRGRAPPRGQAPQGSYEAAPQGYAPQAEHYESRGPPPPAAYGDAQPPPARGYAEKPGGAAPAPGGTYYGGPPPAAEAPPTGGDYYGAQDRYGPGSRAQRYDEYPQAGPPDHHAEPSRSVPPPAAAPAYGQ